MKWNKYLMLGLAGLAFAACSNEEDAVNNSQISGAVSIKIQAPTLTRTSNATSDDVSSVEVVPQEGSKVIIKLDADKGSNTIELTPEQWNAGQDVTFWGVENPKSVTVSMNGGAATYDEVDITTLQQMPVAIPVYGSASAADFTTDGTSDVPNSYEDVDSDHQKGPNGYDKDATYQMWQVEVTLEIPVARLEVSGITHQHTLTADAASCKYSQLNIAGVYLDNVKKTGEGTRTDVYFEAGNGSGTEIAFLKDPISPAENFLNGGSWPAAGQAYAFNFYAPTEQEITAATTDDAKKALNPKFKIYFTDALGSGDAVSTPRYAMITNYKDSDNNPLVLQKGHIYRIVRAELTDENIIGDEEGNTLIGVEVTVTEATWTVKTIEADWAE
ncbi:hypothetical protein [uncultured Bacteroides sp.]|uniref:hypothetical protein n=1 Tax=uncultured Bacteroides sp. TaxID=162156 RepID=UPI0026179E2E|nr:hypothetical protein [uncultured Bacteroides sp.]